MSNFIVPSWQEGSRKINCRKCGKKEEGGVTELPFRQLLGGTDKNRKRPDTTFVLSVDYISYWIKKIGINAP
jgi:hypothetical protein